MLFHFKVIAALFENKMSNKSSKLHFHFSFSCPPPAKKSPKFNLNLQSQAAKETDASGLSSSSTHSLTKRTMHQIR